jgi:uncharacterized protein YdhG (YjbR/CyaY superfamily)
MNRYNQAGCSQTDEDVAMTESARKPPASVDEYIAGFPADQQERLQSLRRAIQAAAPEATEVMNYGVPTFKLNGNLVHFGAFKHHIGFYPTPAAITAFRDRLTAYKVAQGSIQFPNGQPLPLDLVAEIVRFRVEAQQKPKR